MYLTIYVSDKTYLNKNFSANLLLAKVGRLSTYCNTYCITSYLNLQHIWIFGKIRKYVACTEISKFKP